VGYQRVFDELYAHGANPTGRTRPPGARPTRSRGADWGQWDRQHQPQEGTPVSTPFHPAPGTSSRATPRAVVTGRVRMEPWMALALAEARRATDTGDVPIGAVVLGPDGTVLGTGRNEREASGDPTAHAEVLALRAAAAARRDTGRDDGWRLEDCTLVVTLEPCAMCAGAIVLARIPRLVFGAWDPKAGACGSVFDVVREPRLNHWVEVFPGVREVECSALLTGFFRGHRG
jgi:tRNA(adenine34) deaminase